MRVLITGAGGTLGAVLASMLAVAGHEPVLFDVRPLETRHRFIQGDIRRLEDVRRAVDGAEFVVHTAAIHGIHLRDHTPEQFHDLNLTGTFNIWEAAVRAEVSGMVFSSTMGVYGDSRRPPRHDAVVRLGEDVPLLPNDIYGYTKVAGEEMCRYYGRRHGIPSVALRYGMFVPEPFFREGIRLLYGGVDARDVARAVVAAMDAVAEGRVRWDACNVMSSVPFVEEDGPQLRADPLAALDRYYPGAGDLLRERGVERLAPVTEYYPIRHAAEVMGFQPQRNLEQWLEELATRPGMRAQGSPPWP